jgi:hypothetical protein
MSLARPKGTVCVIRERHAGVDPHVHLGCEERTSVCSVLDSGRTSSVPRPSSVPYPASMRSVSAWLALPRSLIPIGQTSAFDNLQDLVTPEPYRTAAGFLNQRMYCYSAT